MMSEEIKAIVADECENFLGWRVGRVGGAIRCRVWVLHRHDEDVQARELGNLQVPDMNPDFEALLTTDSEAVDYLAGDDVFLHTTARELMRQL